uniref:Polysaccharide biosynthesis domain-containing protein n=1 Tax=Clastoptera arizonana TaxID=38151 RepID=A0A1B6C3I6_9HEMI
MSAEGLISASSVLSRPAEEFENDPTVEAMWAIRAYEHAEVYFNILCSVDPQILRLTPHDDLIYRTFRDEFSGMDVRTLDEDQIKSIEGKKKWRDFCEKFKDIVEDYNFGTLLRINTTGDYSEENSILTTRVQFYAIELARNREGYNDTVRLKFKPNKISKQ